MSNKIFRLIMALALMVVALSVSTVLAQDGPVATGEGIVCPDGDAEITFGGGSVGSELEFAQRAPMFSTVFARM
jgi:hypothetical protein